VVTNVSEERIAPEDRGETLVTTYQTTRRHNPEKSLTNLFLIVNLFENYSSVHFIMLVENTCFVTKKLIMRLVGEALVIQQFDCSVEASFFSFVILTMRRRNVLP
jgi:hypothetical protein